MKLNDLFDDADFCDQCGKSLPIDAYHGRRMYCSAECKTRSFTVLDSEARRAARAGRPCRICKGTISDARTSQAIYCETCRGPKSCDHCRRVFQGRTVASVYCSRTCTYAAISAKAGKLPRNCENCGTAYKPGRRTSRSCSLSCNTHLMLRARRAQKARAIAPEPRHEERCHGG